ncbi:glutathione S-transferase [Caballeronia mineralivorans PML1(12)]|uniref:Glutathione S-transferase n=1 Tax=Caballeronia mineralivorans PML1(12) TaxID=908627 RepID=A0A0J1CQL8_9BURK|nr:glutathione S-transferase family protein [Caballeronia mineralivorans]KLU22942.1 glutathione S-transferase [Caballeronia mineralivorans PML1(12)]
MRLYYWPKTRAFRALWMLEELRVPYEFAYVNIRAGEQNAPAFCAVNPMSKLPALDDGGVCVAESGAVLLYLADKYPQAGLGVPLDDPLRGRFLQWMFFTGACLEPAMAERMTGAPGNSVSFGWGDLGRVEKAIESALADGPWLLGERFTAADILVSSTLQIAYMAKLIEPGGVLSDYVARATSREAHERAVSIDKQEAQKVPSAASQQQTGSGSVSSKP